MHLKIYKMKKQLLFAISLTVGILSGGNIIAQNWVDMMQEPGRNFYEIQNSFNDYWKDKDITQKGKGYKQFKDWEYFVGPRVYPSGDLSLISNTWKNYEEYLGPNNTGKYDNNNQIASTTWTAMGPMGPMSGVATNGFPRKAGRDNFITFHPSTANTYWCGAPAGGLWKTTNNGASWATTTNSLSVIGCSDLAIDPSNPNIMYLATGDGDAGDTYCIGVLKSIDGGTTWSTTGLTFAVSLQRRMRRLIINTANPQILMAATNVGIYRTTNGGTNWTQINSSNSYDLEFNTAGTNTVYAAGTTFSISTNGGTSFTQIGTGIPTSGSTRMNIATTPANANYVYVLSASTANNLQGVYRSTNGGTTFSLMANTPNILANSCTSPSTDGQGWYDLAFAASPLNANEIVSGGVNVYRSLNGGSTWSIIGCWVGTGNPPYVHADHHELQYTTTGTLYSCNDGGIFQYTGSSWTDLTAPRNIAQIYKIGLSTLSPNLWITGHQDNGSNIYNNGTYAASMAGDGMDCFIDRTNNNNMFASYYNGQFQKSTTGGGSWNACVTGMTGGALWVAPWKQDPVAATTLYAGRIQVFKSTNLGTSWTQTGALPGINTGQGVIEFAIAPSNNSIIVALHGTPGVYKSINAGTSWTNITGTLPVGSAMPTNVAFDPANANNIYVTFSGFSAGNKVFKSTNGGTTWTNISLNLPNLPANCIKYETGTNGRVYVGMDVGVYYIDNVAPAWTAYNLSLPNTPVFDLEISPAAATKLRAATYGRGVYEVDVVPANQPPTSAFTFTGSVCTGVAKVFTDASTNSPTIWSWSVTPVGGVTINTPSAQNPTITFANTGTYTVSLMASNGFGAGNIVSQTLAVTATPTVIVSNSVQTICAGVTATMNATGAATYSWNTGAVTSSVAVTPAVTTIYTVTGFNGACPANRTATINVNPSPTVTVNSPSLCGGGNVILTASGATTYTWSTGPNTSTISVSPTVTTVYTITGTSGGCNNTKTATVTVNTMPTVSVNSAAVCLGNSTNLTASGASTYSWNTGGITNVISVSPSVTTVYTVTGTNGACSAASSATVVVNPLPNISATSIETFVCIGHTVSLNASGAITYTWQPGNLNGANISDTPGASTVYTVTGTDANGCDGITTIAITVDPCAGILQNGNETASFNVFPNPVNDKLTVNVNTSKAFECTIEINDATGKLVLKQQAKFGKDKSEQQINISSFAGGVYFLKLVAKEGSSQVIKVVKE